MQYIKLIPNSVLSLSASSKTVLSWHNFNSHDNQNVMLAD